MGRATRIALFGLGALGLAGAVVTGIRMTSPAGDPDPDPSRAAVAARDGLVPLPPPPGGRAGVEPGEVTEPGALHGSLDDPDFAYLAEPEDVEKVRELPRTIDYPVLAKYSHEPLSEVSYSLVGAWDEQLDSGDLGSRRAFIAVVEPGTSDAALEDLARDVRAKHRDAQFVNLQVFDSTDAATRASWTDGGRARREHLVAEMRCNNVSPREWLEIRGRRVDL